MSQQKSMCRDTRITCVDVKQGHENVMFHTYYPKYADDKGTVQVSINSGAMNRFGPGILENVLETFLKHFDVNSAPRSVAFFSPDPISF